MLAYNPVTKLKLGSTFYPWTLSKHRLFMHKPLEQKHFTKETRTSAQSQLEKRREKIQLLSQICTHERHEYTQWYIFRKMVFQTTLILLEFGFDLSSSLWRHSPWRRKTWWGRTWAETGGPAAGGHGSSSTSSHQNFPALASSCHQEDPWRPKKWQGRWVITHG